MLVYQRVSNFVCSKTEINRFRGFPKMDPEIIHFSRIVHSKTSCWLGLPHLWKPPFVLL